MKKIIFIFIILFISNNVEATNIYYSPYGEYSEYSQNEVLKTDLIEVEEEIRYKWYKENLQENGYKPYNSVDKFDLNDCYQTEFTGWSDIEPQASESIIFETRNKYLFTMSKEVRYLHFTNLLGSYDAFRIPELIIKYLGKEIDYSYTCIGCWEGFDSTIHNGVFDQNESYISNNGVLIVDLKDLYPVNKIEILYYIFDMGASNVSYTLGFSKNKTDIYAAKDFVVNKENFWVYRNQQFQHYIYDLGIDPNLWTMQVATYTYYLSDYIMNIDTSLEYRSKEKFCMNYLVTKEYLDGYFKDSKDEYIHKEDSKKYYRYKTRDKIVLQPDLIINKIDFDLNDFIVSSTTNYEITSNINYDKNGIYQMNIVANNISITKDVTVDIMENKIKEYQEKIIELEKQLESINKEYQEKVVEYEDKIDILNKNIEQLQEQLNACFDNCEEEKQCLINTIKEKDNLIKQYENTILQFSTKINNLQVEISELLSNIENLNIDNEEKDKLIEQLKNNIIKIQEQSKKANEKIIIEYNDKINILNVQNEVYYEKIKEIEKQKQEQLNSFSQALLKQNNYILDLEEKIKWFESEMLNVQNYKQSYQNINQKYVSATQEKEELKSKLNDYILKIDNNEKVDLFWIYIVILIFLISYVVYKMRKKSIVKNS